MPKSSPFYSFVHYYRDDQLRSGRSLTLQQAQVEAEPLWAAMPNVRKSTFLEIAEARRMAINERPHRPRFSHTREVGSLQERMRTCIENYLSNIADVRSQPFYFASVYQESPTRFPSEISIVRFTIARGAESFLHFIFNPEVSKGQFSLINEAIEKPMTVIPIEGTANSQKNLEEVLDVMYAFCSGVVFTLSHATQSAIKCFSKLQENRSSTGGEIVPLDAEELIQILWKRSKDCANAKLSHIHNVCSSMMDLGHLACSFHKAKNDTPVCTLWKPYQLAYTLSQVLAEAYSIHLTEGYHKSRKNWVAPGKFYSGKGQYEDWVFKTFNFETAWDLSSSAAASASNAQFQSNWDKSIQSEWGL